MIEVRNLLFQPLTLHLSAGAESLHLGPRQRKVIQAGEVSPELEKAAKRGFVSLSPKDNPASRPMEFKPAKPQPATKRSRKGRN